MKSITLVKWQAHLWGILLAPYIVIDVQSTPDQTISFSISLASIKSNVNVIVMIIFIHLAVVGMPENCFMDYTITVEFKVSSSCQISTNILLQRTSVNSMTEENSVVITSSDVQGGR